MPGIARTSLVAPVALESACEMTRFWVLVGDAEVFVATGSPLRLVAFEVREAFMAACGQAVPVRWCRFVEVAIDEPLTNGPQQGHGGGRIRNPEGPRNLMRIGTVGLLEIGQQCLFRHREVAPSI
jgi:hypothetical protein